MAVHAARLHFSLDPLIAEAKRRARQRRVLVAVVVLLVAAAGAGAAIVASSSPGVTPGQRPIQAAIVASVIGPPEQPSQLRDGTRIFSPRFGIAVVLGNGSREPVTLERVRAVLNAHWPVGQIGARFKLWKHAESCVQSFVVACTARPIAAARPSPLRVPPGHQVLAQLNFRFLACSRREAQAVLSVQKITVVYRLRNGNQIRQHAPFVLGYAFPARVRRPRSLPNKFGRIATRPCHR
jgi:hypothetical protein